MAPKRYVIASFIVFFLLVTISQFPLALAVRLGIDGKTAPFFVQSISGSIWHGQADGVVFAGQDWGTVDVRTSVWSIFSGRSAIRLKWRGPAQTGTAFLAPDGEGFTLSQLESQTIFTASGLSGSAQIMGGRIVYSGAACIEAEAQVTIKIQTQPNRVPGILRCIDGRLNLVASLNGIEQSFALTPGPQ